jgi:Holliday junction DNA helicase RuvB
MSEHQEINDVAPSSLSHIIGQKSVKAQVAVGLEAAFADNKKFDSALLVGPPGVGKSALAKIISLEMATEFHEVIGQSIKNTSDVNALLLAASDKDVCHIDEAHELPKEQQTALYLAIDQKKLFIKGSKSKPTSIPINDFTLLLSTTDEYCLLQPLRDRMKLLLRFQFYTEEELTTLLKQRSANLGWSVDEAVLPLIAQRSRGTPRLALRMLQSCRRVCRSQGEKAIEPHHLATACLLEQIDLLGLGHVEQHYLRILADGPNRLNVIGSMLGLPPRTVSQVTEPLLLRMGLVMKDDQGKRVLTEKGREHLAKSVTTDG